MVSIVVISSPCGLIGFRGDVYAFAKGVKGFNQFFLGGGYMEYGIYFGRAEYGVSFAIEVGCRDVKI